MTIITPVISREKTKATVSFQIGRREDGDANHEGKHKSGYLPVGYKRQVRDEPDIARLYVVILSYRLPTHIPTPYPHAWSPSTFPLLIERQCPK